MEKRDKKSLYDSTVEVYVSSIQNDDLGAIYPPLRDKEILECKNKRVKRQKYYVWKLLEYALKNSLGLEMKDLTFDKMPSGKWSTAACEISLSHCDDVIAVALSPVPVGIDVEKIRPVRDSLAKKTLCECEYEQFCNLNKELQSDFFIQKWTQKESLFKQCNYDDFTPQKILADENKVCTKKIVINDEEYYLSVATQTPENVRIFSNVDVRSALTST